MPLIRVHITPIDSELIIKPYKSLFDITETFMLEFLLVCALLKNKF